MGRIEMMFFGDHDQFDICEPDEDRGSQFGNYDIDIYDEDIEALKAGKKLVYVDEYGTIVRYKEGPKPEPREDDVLCEFSIERGEDGSVEYPFDFSEVDDE